MNNDKDLLNTELPQKINDFVLTVCTVNGSGSASANTTLYRALFRMGIPVSGKNIFPSNIKGEPTWFVIRASAAGYIGRVEFDDIVVCLNPASIAEDIRYCVPGGVIFYADHLIVSQERDDLIYYPMPIKELSKTANIPRNMKDYLENMLYVGIVSHMLGIAPEFLQDALTSQFGDKQQVVQSNFDILMVGMNWAEKNLVKKDIYAVKQLPPLTEHIMSDGNTASALGSLYGGMQFCGWYPITPATSMVETMKEYATMLRKDPDSNKMTYAIVQAEDELAAIGMACGAGWAGLRSMTSTSGPGLSLMVEYLGLAYYTETPIVVWDVQRVGPSTGMPTRTSQGDLTMVYFLGHGDTNQIILIPGSVNECFEFGWRALNIAEKYQAPVFVMSDLDLGMNIWMTEKFVFPNEPIDRGKVLWEEDLEKLKGDWGRYRDVDGDGVPYRTVMGNQFQGAAWFARGTGHDENARYSENAQVWQEMLDRIKKKYETARNALPEPKCRNIDGSRIGVISMGSTHPAMIEAQDMLEALGINVDYLRVRSLPTSDKIREFIASHERTYVVEMNRDGQLHQILSLETPLLVQKLKSVAHTDGLPLTAKWIVEKISIEEEGI